MRKKKILVVECNITGEWWSFEKLDSLIDHFHWYYKDPVMFDKDGCKPSRRQLVEELTAYGETELHSKKEDNKHEETFLYVKMVYLR